MNFPNRSGKITCVIVLNCYNNENCAQDLASQAIASPKTFLFLNNLKLLAKFIKEYYLNDDYIVVFYKMCSKVVYIAKLIIF